MSRLLVTMGDPAGIGPRVLLQSLNRFKEAASISVVGDVAWLKRAARTHRIDIPWRRFHWIDLANVPSSLRPGKVQPSAGRAAYEYLVEAVRLIKAGEADALVTAPVSKQAIVEAGIRWIGHTEFLAESFRCQATMMFVVKDFRVSLVTTHVGLRELPSLLTRARIRKTIQATREALIRDFKIRSPRIGVAALNPHAGENGIFGGEEKKVILPALGGFGPSVQGPLPTDSLMQAAAKGAYDGVVALYHDQALIAVKLLGWEQAVNVTLGLPFVRTSPVHGTAFDLVSKGYPDSSSMQSAIRLAIQLSRRRAQRSRR